MARLTNTMIAFRENPEDLSRVIVPSGRKDEVGVAEYELQTMQQSLHDMLAQRSRLAALGLAVSKFNHDLRNLLASAQLFSDRLADVPDPTVQRFAPKMIQALDRAIAFCQSTLSYGRAHEAPPQRSAVALATLADEVRDTMGLGPEARIAFVNAVPDDLTIDADPDHLFRVLLNIGRNAQQALEARARVIGKGLRCLVCQNQSIDDSDAQLARDLRMLIREQLLAGASDDEALAFVVERYGDYVLLRPPLKPTTYLLWLGPFLLFAIAITVTAFYLHRRRRHLAPPRTLSPDEERRIQEILDRHP